MDVQGVGAELFEVGAVSTSISLSLTFGVYANE